MSASRSPWCSPTAPAIAEDALEAIEVEIEALPAVADRHASAQDTALLFEDKGTNLAIKFHAVLGDAAAAFKDAPYVRRESFRTQRHMALPMEPRGLLAEWDAAQGRLTVSGARQSACSSTAASWRSRWACRKSAIDIDRERRRRRLRRARRVLSRGFPHSVRRAPYRPAGEMDRGPAREPDGHEPRARGGMRRRDRLHARRHHPRPARPCLRRHRRLYAHQRRGRRAQRRAVHVGPLSRPEHRDRRRAAADQQDAGRHLSRAGPLRGRFLPRAAARHGGAATSASIASSSAAAISCHGSEMPYPIATITPFESKDEFDSGDYQITLDRCLDEIGWAEKSKLQGKLIDGRYHGLARRLLHRGRRRGTEGNARAWCSSRTARSRSMSARPRSGRASRRCSRRSPPTRSKCRWTRIRGVFHGSTAFVSDGYGAYHSRSMVMGGSAMLDAASESARRDPRRRRRKRLGCAPAEIEIVEGDKAVGPGGTSIAARRDSRRRHLGRRRLPQQEAHLHLRRPCRACGGRSQARPRRAHRLCRRRGCRPHHQSADAARPGHRLGWCRAWAAPCWSISSTTSRASS